MQVYNTDQTRLKLKYISIIGNFWWRNKFRTRHQTLSITESIYKSVRLVFRGRCYIFNSPSTKSTADYP